MKTTKYQIKMYDPKHGSYFLLWEGESLEMAERMFNRPYNGDEARMLIKITEETLYEE